MRKCTQRDNLYIFFRFMGLMGDRLPVYLGAILVSTIGDAGRRIANSYLVKNIVTAAQSETQTMCCCPFSEILRFLSYVFCFGGLALYVIILRDG